MTLESHGGHSEDGKFCRCVCGYPPQSNSMGKVCISTYYHRLYLQPHNVIPLRCFNLFLFLFLVYFSHHRNWVLKMLDENWKGKFQKPGQNHDSCKEPWEMDYSHLSQEVLVLVRKSLTCDHVSVRETIFLHVFLPHHRDDGKNGLDIEHCFFLHFFCSEGSSLLGVNWLFFPSVLGGSMPPISIFCSFITFRSLWHHGATVCAWTRCDFQHCMVFGDNCQCGNTLNFTVVSYFVKNPYTLIKWKNKNGHGSFLLFMLLRLSCKEQIKMRGNVYSKTTWGQKVKYITGFHFSTCCV